MKTTHTPGPWEFGECGTENAVVYIGDQTIGGVYKGGDEDILLPADARLIAAAPELLEACKASLELHLDRLKPNQWCFNWLVEPLEKCPCTICKIRSAISKAEGQS